MGIFQNLFKSVKNDQNKTYTQFQEIGTYKSYFGNFGNNIYMSDDKSCTHLYHLYFLQDIARHHLNNF